MRTENSLIPTEILEEARGQLREVYAAQGRKELTEANIEALAGDTFAHAMQQMHRLRRIFLAIPPLPTKRYDAKTRAEVTAKAAANHRKELLAIFTDRGISTQTAEKIVSQIVAREPEHA